jgi:two-component system OmpR family sensor kinase
MLKMSLTARIGLMTGVLVTMLWLAAAVWTVSGLYHEVNEVFDRDLKATAERILPIVIHDRFDRDDDLEDKDIRRMRAEEDDTAFVVMSESRGLLLRSAGADTIAFPTEDGFSHDATWRFYRDGARRGDVWIAVARPLAARKELYARALMASLLPLLAVVPLTLFGIWVAVRRGLRPLDGVRQELAKRGPMNLEPLPLKDLPRELSPVVASANTLLARIAAGFDSERSFASNAAHEMRTPVAGAIAQAQRLQSESRDPDVRARAAEIEGTLKRLNRYNEKLMQLARAEGARLRREETMDLRPVARMIVEDFTRAEKDAARISLDLPDGPVISDLDPDAFGIVLRNLLENALRHGAKDRPVAVSLTPGSLLRVCNEGSALPPEQITRLTARFSRGDGAGDGTGLGLSIVGIIAERTGADLRIVSPKPSAEQGVEVSFRF